MLDVRLSRLRGAGVRVRLAGRYSYEAGCCTIFPTRTPESTSPSSIRR